MLHDHASLILASVLLLLGGWLSERWRPWVSGPLVGLGMGLGLLHNAGLFLDAGRGCLGCAAASSLAAVLVAWPWQHWFGGESWLYVQLGWGAVLGAFFGLMGGVLVAVFTVTAGLGLVWLARGVVALPARMVSPAARWMVAGQLTSVWLTGFIFPLWT